MKSNESAEDYLEAILVLKERGYMVRAVDISRHLGYKKSSVSVAMKNLIEKGLVRITSQGFIVLTESGMEIADKIYERHKILSEWFLSLGISEENALKDACRVEHYLSEESFAAIKKHIAECRKE
ncbi:MAG: metal-dependent transcriptional regulator [Lachnospiraceae bacterium]|nr:metal-dependent transcriptional regulator [Lachnospiraceae bacterium]MBO6299769.1 metal-dependent transcriptional regulator [Lachnospiraceae bacterium]MBP3295752.1 metal-dependent transcriptional regulator [Lachnospiraceae bacterium]MCR5128615.1 metal-dependent transcriptional regulator [Lachnospiraceae bacterium]